MLTILLRRWRIDLQSRRDSFYTQLHEFGVTGVRHQVTTEADHFFHTNVPLKPSATL